MTSTRPRRGPAPGRDPRLPGDLPRGRPAGPGARRHGPAGTGRPRQQPGWFSASGVVDTEKVAVLEAALGAPSDATTAPSGPCCSPPCAASWPWDRSSDAGPGRRRRNMARRLGDPATIIRALNLVGDAIDLPSNVGQRRADRTEALALAEALGDPVLLYWAATYCRMTAVQIGDFELGTRCFDIARALSERLRQPMLQWNSTFMEAADAIMTRRLRACGAARHHCSRAGNQVRPAGRRELLWRPVAGDPTPARTPGRTHPSRRGVHGGHPRHAAPSHDPSLRPTSRLGTSRVRGRCLSATRREPSTQCLSTSCG